MTKSQVKGYKYKMDMLEAIGVMLVVTGVIFCSLIILHVISDVYSCSLACIKEKLKELISSIWR